LTQYAVLAWQIAFPMFAWHKNWRPVLLVGAVLGWIGSSLLYRQPLFGPVLLLGCLSYLTAGEWRGLSEWARLLRRSRPGRSLAPRKNAPVDEVSHV
jgi:hypothetical protein